MRAGSWPSIFLIYALGVLAAATISEALPALGEIAAYLHLTQPQAGLVISLPAAVLAFGSLAGGWYVDRLGDKPMLLFGCIVMTIGDVGVIMAPTLLTLFAARIVGGIGYLCVAVSAVTMLTRMTSGKRRTIALALWSSFVPVSFAVPLMLAALFGGNGNWHVAFITHAVAAVLLGFAACLLPGAPRRHTLGSNRTHTAGLGTVIRTPAVFCLGIAFAASAFLQTGVVSTLPMFLMHHYAMPVARASQVGTFAMIANALGCLTVGYLLNRGTSVRTLVVVGVSTSCACALALYLANLAAPLAIAAALAFFFSIGLIVGLWALLPRVAPNMQSLGATSGLVTQLTLWGVLFGPPAAFAAQASGDASLVAINMIGASVLTLVLMSVVWTRKSRQPEEHGTLANT